MPEVAGRLLQFPGEPGGDAVIRVDLKYLLSRKQPYTCTSLHYRWSTLWTADIPPDYGDMLSQQLRRIEGLHPPMMTPYGFKAAVGAMYDMRAMARTVKRAVETTLAAGTPWIVTRESDGSNWSFHFGRRLIVNRFLGTTWQPDGENPNFTPFGRRLARELHDPDNQLGSAYAHHLFMGISDAQDWSSVDAEYERRVTEVASTRGLTVDWE